MPYLAACFSTPAVFLLLGLTLPCQKWRGRLGPLLTTAYLVWLFHETPQLAPVERLFCCSLWLLYFIKGWALLQIDRSTLKTYSPAGLLLYSYIWPGVDVRPFREREAADEDAARWFVTGFPTCCLGIAGLLGLAFFSPSIPAPLLGLAGVLAILTTVHLGYSDILSCAMRLLGFPVTRLFDAPLKSRTLADFWSNRWNRPFVEMNRLLFQPIIRRSLSGGYTVLALFLLSGLLHELALSYPVGRGMGGPLLYFFIQGVGLKIERERGLGSRAWTWLVVFLPLPLLFHGGFLSELVLPPLLYLKSLPPFHDSHTALTTLLTLAGWGHFLVLVASSQVPSRLEWKKELVRLRPLNRKLLWTYGAYIASMILLWGLLTLNLIPELLRGEKSALALAGIMALFWWSRVFIDAFYFEHSDWPAGVEFVLGHTMLTTLFVTLSSIYTGLILWHLL
jgi:alginate O-acetyltransferase complex protein AlgI